MKNIILEKYITSANVPTFVFDRNFLETVEDLVIFFDSICKLVIVCQKSISNIAAAAEKWLYLSFPFDTSKTFLNKEEIIQ